MMKKASVVLVVMVAVLSMGSCGNKTQQVPFDDGDSAAIANADPTVYGVSGASTTMNTLQVITDTGDTLMFDISTARDNNRVYGGLQAGDRMAVLPAADNTTAETVVNLSTLLGNWVMLNPLDGSEEVGIRIKEGGIVEGISSPSLSYRTWRLVRGQLEIVLVREESAGEEEVGLYDLMMLGPDSLVYRDAEDVYRYGRQRAHKEYGKEIKLEESDATDFVM